ncbi:Aminotransferase, partial [Pseudomonas syringae pv. maculicola]
MWTKRHRPPYLAQQAASCGHVARTVPGAYVCETLMADQGSPRRFARIDRLPPYVFNITAELKMAARRRGEDIIDLSMGNPDGATPPHIVEKLVTVAQREDTHGYSTSRGIPRLRRAISNWYKKRYEVDIDPESEAIVTIGSKEGLAHLMLATLDQG